MVTFRLTFVFFYGTGHLANSNFKSINSTVFASPSDVWAENLWMELSVWFIQTQKGHDVNYLFICELQSLWKVPAPRPWEQKSPDPRSSPARAAVMQACALSVYLHPAPEGQAAEGSFVSLLSQPHSFNWARLWQQAACARWMSVTSFKNWSMLHQLNISRQTPFHRCLLQPDWVIIHRSRKLYMPALERCRQALRHVLIAVQRFGCFTELGSLLTWRLCYINLETQKVWPQTVPMLLYLLLR